MIQTAQEKHLADCFERGQDDFVWHQEFTHSVFRETMKAAYKEGWYRCMEAMDTLPEDEEKKKRKESTEVYLYEQYFNKFGKETGEYLLGFECFKEGLRIGKLMSKY